MSKRQPPSKKKDYEVGYGKPPRKHRFKKRGADEPPRRRGPRKPTAPDIDAILQGKVALTVKGRPRKMHPNEAMAQSLLKKAMAGEIRAIRQLISLAKKYGLLVQPDPPSGQNVVVIPRNTPGYLIKTLLLLEGRPPWSDETIRMYQTHYIAICCEGIRNVQLGWEGPRRK